MVIYNTMVELCNVKSKLLMWLGNDDKWRNFSFFVDWIVLEVGQLSGAMRRIKLVGEESKLHLMAWGGLERRHTAIFLLLCRCLSVGVIMFLWLCAAHLVESELFISCVSSLVWMTLDGLNNTRARDFGSYAADQEQKRLMLQRF